MLVLNFTLSFYMAMQRLEIAWTFLYFGTQFYITMQRLAPQFYTQFYIAMQRLEITWTLVLNFSLPCRGLKLNKLFMFWYSTLYCHTEA